MPLPAEFTALYRLFLRATSAAVLHNGPATRGLRRLYRPTFDAAASSVKRLENMDKDLAECQNVKGWLKTFDERINNTLSFLYASSQSRGLSHQVVSRLSFLSRSNYPWTRDLPVLIMTKKHDWDPKLDPESPEYTYTPPYTYSGRKRRGLSKRASEAEFIQKCWGALGEVIQMAEARDGLMFGKVKFKLQEIRKKKFY